MAENVTEFTAIYNRFLGKITDDMYMELTPEDTVKDLQRLLIDSIPGFEFPRKDLYDYELRTEVIPESELQDGDFAIGVIWGEIPSDNSTPPDVIVERSTFNCELTSEEINILAVLMKHAWLQRQVASVENTRMKFSGADFKFTSQANHLAKLLNLLSEVNREAHHMQRLYRRRKVDKDGLYASNWSVLRSNSALD